MVRQQHAASAPAIAVAASPEFIEHPSVSAV